jgi:hypothetical protein
MALGSTQPPLQWVPAFFPEGKAAGSWVWLPILTEVKERVELYCYSPSGALTVSSRVNFTFNRIVKDGKRLASQSEENFATQRPILDIRNSRHRRCGSLLKFRTVGACVVYGSVPVVRKRRLKMTRFTDFTNAICTFQCSALRYTHKYSYMWNAAFRASIFTELGLSVNCRHLVYRKLWSCCLQVDRSC